jgi:hypothetical protein
LIINIVNQIIYNLLFKVLIMSKHLIFPSISLPFTLSFITIESLNFIDIQTKVNLLEKHQEPVPSDHDTNIN